MDRSVLAFPDADVRIKGMTALVLTRLALARESFVSVDEIFSDVWPAEAGRNLDRARRTKVQQRISEIRATIDANLPAGGSALLVTDRGGVTRYRLAVDPANVDVYLFRDLVIRSRDSDIVQAETLLEQALGLWRARPLLDADRHAFARAAIDELHGLHREATRRLTVVLNAMGRSAEAASRAELLGLTDFTQASAPIVASMRALGNAAIVRRIVSEHPPSEITIVSGDLLAQDDAHLVVGFCDTFDTDTGRDPIISPHSLQGQLTARLYDDDPDKLDAALTKALRPTARSGVEPRSAKPRGKRVRYPIGTVAVLHQARRCVFGLAYSHMSNDLVTRSSLQMLESSLDRLWEAVAYHGQRSPVAIGVIGSGLARVDQTTLTELVGVIAGSFVKRVQAGPVCRELRIVLRPRQSNMTRLPELAAAVNNAAALGSSGMTQDREWEGRMHGAGVPNHGDGAGQCHGQKVQRGAGPDA